MKIKQRGKIRYQYKDKLYKVAFIAKMKIGQVWLKCVIYQSYSDKMYYVREHGEFFEKFKPVEDKNDDTKNILSPAVAGGL
jgi:hypothetical protein